MRNYCFYCGAQIPEIESHLLEFGRQEREDLAKEANEHSRALKIRLEKFAPKYVDPHQGYNG